MPPMIDSIPMATNSTHYWSTHDFDEQASLLSGWNQDYLQMSSGHFNGYVSDIKFEDAHLFLEYTNQALLDRKSVV